MTSSKSLLAVLIASAAAQWCNEIGLDAATGFVSDFTNCQDCVNSCNVVIPFACQARRSACRSFQSPFALYVDGVNAVCSNDPIRNDNGDQIVAAIQMLQQFNLKQASDFAGVEFKWCQAVGLGADAMVPNPNKILISPENMNICTADLAALIAHEMCHISQYRAWGTDRFRCEYTKAMIDLTCEGRPTGPSNAVERPCYNIGNEIETIFDGLCSAPAKFPLGQNARDIAAGTSNNVWIVDDGSQPAGGRLRMNTGRSNWDVVLDNIRCVTMAVADDGYIWTVNGFGHVHRVSPSGDLELKGGSARDISIGINGQVWIVDDATIPESDSRGGMIRRNTGGSTWDHILTNVRAMKVAITPEGTVWYLDGNGDVFTLHPTGEDLAHRGGTARDIDIGPNGDVWIVDNDGIPESNEEGGMIRKNTGGNNWNVVIDVRAVHFAVVNSDEIWATSGSGQVFKIIVSQHLLVSNSDNAAADNLDDDVDGSAIRTVVGFELILALVTLLYLKL